MISSKDKINIEIREGARFIESFNFTTGSKVLIGRNVGADVRLDSRTVSRRHANLHFLSEGFRVEDLSLNGTDINGTESEILAYGTAFSIGGYKIIVKLFKEKDLTPDLKIIRQNALLQLIEQMDLNHLGGNSDNFAPKVETALDRILFSLGVNDNELRTTLKKELRDEAIGLGPIEDLLNDPSISEIMVISYDKIYVEKKGTIKKSDKIFSSEDSVKTVIDRIIAPLGRRVDESSPMVDARLSDGSRVNAVIPPIALNGSAITIRKFSKKPFKMENLIQFKTLSKEMGDFLQKAVASKQNIVISGGTGSGKTTLLNVLSSEISHDERVITIEDAAELQLNQPHLVSLESKPGNAEGRGAITIRDLVKNSLRMRPDRIVVGECRGGEALDMLQAMNTGHDGSLTTTHANSPKEAVARLETLSLMAGLNLPSIAIREQIASAVDFIVQQSRFSDGSRKITSICEIGGMDENGQVKIHEIFRFDRRIFKSGQDGFISTGRIPAFILNN
ncbi:MAG: Flp pilus assembly complex ATPase component TadA [Deltaproteobacteria bacterium]|nr:Flp pilus assembly complex ATPase component TadA [Deltaproteobacteria bacterium]